MPGIDFDALRREITMEQVLKLIGFQPTHRSVDHWYGYCPLDRCGSRRSFSANMVDFLYYCHKCHRKGNQLQLWAAYLCAPLHPASIELCAELGREVPWLRHGKPTWQSFPGQRRGRRS